MYMCIYIYIYIYIGCGGVSAGVHRRGVRAGPGIRWGFHDYTFTNYTFNFKQSHWISTTTI